MASFQPRRDIIAFSHINFIVDDVDVAAEFYETVLGFEPASNSDGPMNYPRVDLATFARNAGFDDGRVDVDIRFLKHPGIGAFLELFRYHHPTGDQTIHRRATNDLGGVRHIAVEVSDAVAAYHFIRAQQDAWSKRGREITILGQDHEPEELTPFPIRFFYWIDPWGGQWEMEEGRPVGRTVQSIVG